VQSSVSNTDIMVLQEAICSIACFNICVGLHVQ